MVLVPCRRSTRLFAPATSPPRARTKLRRELRLGSPGFFCNIFVSQSDISSRFVFGLLFALSCGEPLDVFAAPDFAVSAPWDAEDKPDDCG